ncbi:glycosyltransferase family 39 protein [Aquisphaera insulae]|uniref:glycosyltransferase family 39 protein n=1 Tax=Aquisphaera insulae TaxID=2712864 RepID=UPI0013EB257D|nr:glycosyltransferase family 39 protein [Aquisphaera insulae]
MNHAPRPDAWWITGITACVVLGGLLRGWDLGLLSFWYDEVVTMRLARAATPAALIDLLFRIDATRAPLHPLLLQGWLRIFGESEVAGRSLSLACGMATIGLVGLIGRRAFGRSTGLLAAWLAAISPPLVAYSREARMYAWLVLVTCCCWWLLFEQAEGAWLVPARRRRLARAGYAMGLTGLLYSHPLGMLMAAALGLGSLIFARPLFGSWRRWLLVHAAGLVPALPWLPHYFDHSPEFLSGTLPLKSLLGTPIGFLGGNFLVLGAATFLVVWGLRSRRRDLTLDALGAGRWAWPVCLAVWLILPPVLLYAYSRFRNPVFGPARYTLFVAPAYLVLVAQGIAALPRLPRIVAALAVWFLVQPGLLSIVRDPTQKADWRGFAANVRSRLESEPSRRIVVEVTSTDPAHNVEVETARYYLPTSCLISPFDPSGSVPIPTGMEETLLTIGVKGNATVVVPPAPPGGRWEPAGEFPGLRVYRLEAAPGRGASGR